jgi:hypothetical protein
MNLPISKKLTTNLGVLVGLYTAWTQGAGIWVLVVFGGVQATYVVMQGLVDMAKIKHGK